MRTYAKHAFIVATTAALALTGCASDDPADPAAPAEGNPDAPAENNNAGGGTDAYVNVTINGETWEFSAPFWCVEGYDSTSSDVYSFSSDAKGTFGDANVQFQLSVRDESGQNRLTGDGVRYEITLQDYKNYEDPLVNVDISTDSGVAIVGGTVKATGEGKNLRGETIAFEVDGVCSA